MERLALDLNAVGIVHCRDIPEKELRYGEEAEIEILGDYAAALKRIEEHDFFWVLCWLHKASRDVLETYSWHLKKETDTPYGVFALRSPCRPNPISLTLVRLLKIEGNRLFVDGLDVFDGTAVLDIKPYKKNEAVFSPKAPYIRPQTPEFVYKSIYQKALLHHREACAYLALAVRMALEAESIFGDLSDDALSVEVKGNPCLGDTIQGITGARIANPPRFNFTLSEAQDTCIWQKNGKTMITACKINDIEHFDTQEILRMDRDMLLIRTGQK